MLRNLKLIIAYDGTDFHGWQTQPGMRTVQGEFESIAARVCKHPVKLSGAGRTDAGVHARGQTASFRTETPIPANNLRLAIGHRLPTDIALIHVSDVAADFHASRAARSKLYRYTIINTEERPVREMRQRYGYHCWYPLDMDRLRTAAALLLGRHDFAGFASQGIPRKTTVRTLFRVDLRRVYDEIRIDFEGDGFLYNQVRNMVGTLIEIGRGQWPVERIAQVLETKDRNLAGPTARPHGLCMEWVRY